ncbi:MAG TPA: DivIVA domain-containing protein [Gaiellaceae bacterium]|nr:DivIVA domain-containing protein [Gaiellaceae bacterium]
MSIEALHEAVRKLREVELRHAVRGIDEAQVRDLLHKAADSLANAAREQTVLRDELERLQAANNESAIGKALLAATRAGEAVVAEAQEKAASLSAEAEAQASALLEQVKAQAEKREQETKAAREQFERELADAKQAHAKEFKSAQAEAEAALATAHRELGLLENKAGQLRSLVADMERRIVETARKTLKDLEAFDASASRPTESDLLAALQPVAAATDRADERQADRAVPQAEDPSSSGS